MAKETVQEKAIRYVQEGRVVLTFVSADRDVLEGYVRGDTYEGDEPGWSVRIDPMGSTCFCPARRRCSHIYALKLYDEAVAHGIVDPPDDPCPKCGGDHDRIDRRDDNCAPSDADDDVQRPQDWGLRTPEPGVPVCATCDGEGRQPVANQPGKFWPFPCETCAGVKLR